MPQFEWYRGLLRLNFGAEFFVFHEEIAMKRRIVFAVIFAALLAVEVLIALFVHDGFIRPFFGDVLAVIAVYALARVVFPKKPAALSAAVTAFAFAMELVQLTELSSVFGEGSFLAVLAGACFDPLDLLCYLAGGLVCAAADIAIYRHDKS